MANTFATNIIQTRVQITVRELYKMLKSKQLRMNQAYQRDYIANLRDQYEADIWNVIGEFGLSQRFLQSGQV